MTRRQRSGSSTGDIQAAERQKREQVVNVKAHTGDRQRRMEEEQRRKAGQLPNPGHTIAHTEYVCPPRDATKKKKGSVKLMLPRNRWKNSMQRLKCKAKKKKPRVQMRRQPQQRRLPRRARKAEAAEMQKAEAKKIAEEHAAQQQQQQT